MEGYAVCFDYGPTEDEIKWARFYDGSSFFGGPKRAFKMKTREQATKKLAELLEKEPGGKWEYKSRWLGYCHFPKVVDLSKIDYDGNYTTFKE